jgi:DNA repair protein SbcC/Rad50
MFAKLFKNTPGKAVTPPVEAPSIPKPPAIDPLTLAGDDEALLAFLAEETRHERRAIAARLISDANLSRLADWAKDHDRGIFKDAREREQRLQREAEAAQASLALQARVSALVAAAAQGDSPAANVLADLDRDWAAIDSSLIPTETGVEFVRLRDQLGDHSAQASERLRGFQLQVQQLNQAAQFLEAAWSAEAEPPYEVLAEAPAHVVDAEAAATEAEGSAKSIANALRTAAGRLKRASMALEDDLIKAKKREDFLAAEGERETGNIEKSRERWAGLPPPERPHIASAQTQRLDALHVAWQKARADKIEAEKLARRVGIDNLQALADAIEKAVAEGHVKDAEDKVRESRKLLHDTRDVPEKLAHELARLAGEAARLQGWQRWGAGVSREELIIEAEQLGMAQLAPAIVVRESKKLRERWVALDKDGPATRDHWNRFDKALKQAYAPAKAFFDKEDERRKENSAKREAILAEMQALIAAGLPKVGQTGFDWKSYANHPENFTRRWRELGPAEHTLPKNEREALPKRYAELLREIEAPLTAERSFESKRREQLIAEAKALAETATETRKPEPARGRDGGRDGDRRGARPERGPSLVDRSRQLTAKWQERAKAMPLSRHEENRLWQEFRTAMDAAFANERARGDAQRASANAETAAARALIARWEGLATSSDEKALKAAIHTSRHDWNQLDKLPREVERDLKRRADQAVANMERQLKSLRSGAWGGQVRGLLTALKAKVDGTLNPDTLDGGLPALWKEALAAPASTPMATIETDLLKFELALQIPSPPELEDARRRVQLSQLAEALKGGDRSTILDRKHLDAAIVRLAKAPHDVVGTPRVAAILNKLAASGPQD